MRGLVKSSIELFIQPVQNGQEPNQNGQVITRSDLTLKSKLEKQYINNIYM